MSIHSTRAWEYAKSLSYIRISGSEGEKKAAEFFKEVCDSLGVSARIETYEIDRTDIHAASLRTQSGVSFAAYGVAESGNTPPEGITAPFQYVNNAELDADLLDIRGKIVLAAGGGSMPKALRKLKEKGAVAFIAIHGTYYDDETLIAQPRVRALSEAAKIDLPGISIHMRDAKTLVCNHSGELLTLSVQQTNSAQTARNVVAEIPGTEIPEEAVLFSAHSDTVVYSPGSWDNGTGCVTLLEAMHYFKAHPPKRTVRFLWCGSEEIGSYGSRTYCEMHKDELEHTIYNINIDMLGTPLTRNVFCATASESVLHFTDCFAKIHGWPLKCSVDMYPSDSSLFAMAGVPACCFGQSMGPGGAEIHSHRDTMEQLDPETLSKSISFVICYAETILNACVNPIPRTFDEKITKAIEEWKVTLADFSLRSASAE